MFKNKPNKILKITYFLIVIIILPLIYSYLSAPNLKKYRTENPQKTKFIEYYLKKHGQNAYLAYSFVPLDQIPEALVKAVIFAEDGTFFNHHGVDWQSIYNGFLEIRRRGKIVHGGSTITMQLAKNMFLYPKKTFLRKIVEIITAKRLEKTLTKHRILELYLNLIEWGPGIYGAQNAAQYYFNKNVQDLDETESSLLAAIIMSPRWYNPEKFNPFFARRQQWILNYLLTGDRAISENIQYVPEEWLQETEIKPTKNTEENISANAKEQITNNILENIPSINLLSIKKPLRWDKFLNNNH